MCIIDRSNIVSIISYAVDIMYDAQGYISGGMIKAVTWDSVNEEWHPTVGATDASLSPVEAEYIAGTLYQNNIKQEYKS